MTDDFHSSGLFQSNFANLLRRAGDEFGERVAIVHNAEQTTFQALNQRAGEISRALRERGIGTGDVCAVLAKGPSDAAATFFAVLGVGATGINVNELYRPRQIEFVLTHSRARALLVSGDVLQSLPRPVVTTAEIIVLEDIHDGVSEFSPIACDASAPAQITYTSGSTGRT